MLEIMLKIYSDSNSQSGQESFVLSILGEKSHGTYLEIGAYHATELSNTFLLESKYGWSGFSIEISKSRTKKFNSIRSNKCLNADALKLDFPQVMSEMCLPNDIDYLQVDIEPANNSLACLKRIPFDVYKFRVITFEHDLYSSRDNEKVKEESFEILSSFGYSRVVSNVCNQGNPFEDWYVYPDLISDFDSTSNLSDIEWIDIFK